MLFVVWLGCPVMRHSDCNYCTACAGSDNWQWRSAQHWGTVEDCNFIQTVHRLQSAGGWYLRSTAQRHSHSFPQNSVPCCSAVSADEFGKIKRVVRPSEKERPGELK
eukprot:8411580-Pyramimonas_sp.AAC.2